MMSPVFGFACDFASPFYIPEPMQSEPFQGLPYVSQPHVTPPVDGGSIVPRLSRDSLTSSMCCHRETRTLNAAEDPDRSPEGGAWYCKPKPISLHMCSVKVLMDLQLFIGLCIEPWNEGRGKDQ